MSLLKLKDLQVSAGGKDILFGINLNVNKGEVHVIMGPNGSGKSTLANALVGNPEYSIDGGEILLEGEKINKLEVDERAKKGIFLSFQIPQEIPGLSLFDFLKAAKEAVTGEKVSILKFHKQVKEKMEKIKFDASYLKRELNVGFSGGEKKKSEIIQMAVLEPKLAILDETRRAFDRRAFQAWLYAFDQCGERRSIFLHGLLHQECRGVLQRQGQGRGSGDQRR